MYMGVVLPFGDYILRLILGEIWFQTSGLIFHSVIYHSLIWSLVALLHWVYWRNIRQAVTWFLPLIGLFAYAVFSILSTVAMPFLFPLSHAKFSFNLVNAGYLIPLVLAIIVWTTRKWTRLHGLIVSRATLAILVGFVALMGIVQLNILRTSSDIFINKSDLTIIPTGIVPYNWAVVSYYDKLYRVGNYNLISGWRREVNEKDAFHNFEMVQNALIDPKIHLIYTSAFKNPVASASIQNETMTIDISELTPLDVWWVDNLKLIINKTGQIIDLNVDYRILQL